MPKTQKKLSGFRGNGRSPPPPPRQPRSEYPALNFAVNNHMLTDDERDACIRDDMEVRAHTLFNANHDHPTLLTGDALKLYPGRKWQVLGDRLLGLDPSG